jgi:hypothetical protein
MHVTLGDDFLGLCDKKSSYKHVSNLEWLWSYDHLKHNKGEGLLKLYGIK